MLLCLKLSQKTKTTLDNLLEIGDYQDYSEVVSCAVDNLALLQAELKGHGYMVLSPKDGQEDRTSRSTGDNIPSTSEPAEQGRAIPARVATARDSLEITKRIPSIFAWHEPAKEPPGLVSLSQDASTQREHIPVSAWFFGQYNKFLPVKASCRALAHAMLKQQGGVELEDVSSLVSKQIPYLGDTLAQIDKTNNLLRDNAVSVAFPSSSDKNSKGVLRYVNQFIGSINKDGLLSGFLFDMKFLSKSGHKGKRISLTNEGWRFAALANPILDDKMDDNFQRLSADEIEFLLSHIELNVPVEKYAYKTILTHISKGANTPDSLDDETGKLGIGHGDKQITRSYLATQRSGVISRMCDLKLMRRVREGIRVRYALTEDGKKYLGN